MRYVVFKNMDIYAFDKEEEILYIAAGNKKWKKSKIGIDQVYKFMPYLDVLGEFDNLGDFIYKVLENK